MKEKPEMAESTKRIASLIALYCYNNLSPTEETELYRWINENDENLYLFDEATNKERLQQGLVFMEEIGHEAVIRKKIKELKRKGNLQFTKPVRKKIRPAIRMLRWAAAAMLLLAISLTVLLIYSHKSTAGSDILPGGTRATLTLDDGSEIELHKITDGTFATQGFSTVEKINGKLLYHRLTSDMENNILYNTVTTPVGGTYPVALSDGTNIWLNAASSIRYPAAFTGNEREVTLLTGEIYFEVAKNPRMPFKVKIRDKDLTVEVVGTQFNINAYPEQDSTKITLIEGEIKVVRENAGITTLKAEQEARVPDNGETKLVNKADTQTAIAWKNETFSFNNTNMATIMRQISRWYDMEVVYEGAVPRRSFRGKIGRNNKLSAVLRALQLNGVQCTVRGKKIIVKE